MSRTILFSLALLSCPPVFSQGFQPVFPNLSGAELLDSVGSHYRPSTVLDYAHARDTLFAKVLAVDDDTLRCIYSGYALYLDPTQDPTQYVYLNGSPLGMNTEHGYPQAKGATQGTTAYSDMHHLFPARIPVNEARGDLPYAEIPDAQAQKWFRGAQILNSIPPSDIDAYSEVNASAFEPREAVKGDLARAIFYFYTVYRSQANAADPDFFSLQRPTLCLWAAQDPADSAEVIKTWRIAPYQENKPNPFILDCTLAHRCWCPEVGANCALPVSEAVQDAALGLRLMPNPFAGEGKVEMDLPFAGKVELRLLSLLGQELGRWKAEAASKGKFDLDLKTTKAYAQTAFLEVRLCSAGRCVRQVITCQVGN